MRFCLLIFSLCFIINIAPAFAAEQDTESAKPHVAPATAQTSPSNPQTNMIENKAEPPAPGQESEQPLTLSVTAATTEKKPETATEGSAQTLPDTPKVESLESTPSSKAETQDTSNPPTKSENKSDAAATALPEQNSVIAEQKYDGSLICYNDDTAYVVTIPEGWIADAVTGEKYGVCAFIYQKNETFDTAAAVIYPRIVATPEDKNPVDYLIKQFIATTGKKSGEIAIRQGDELSTTLDTNTGQTALTFKLWYFDNGPAPNQFELVAYYPETKSTLLIVMSSRTKKDRDAAEGTFKKIVGETKKLQVLPKGNTKSN